MWIFTRHGFFSAVCARQGDGKHGQPVDPDRIMVRARVRGHLESLKKRFANPLGECEIQKSIGTDYAYPAIRAEIRVDAGACGTGGGNGLRQLQVGGRPPSGTGWSGLRAFAPRGLVSDEPIAEVRSSGPGAHAPGYIMPPLRGFRDRLLFGVDALHEVRDGGNGPVCVLWS